MYILHIYIVLAFCQGLFTFSRDSVIIVIDYQGQIYSCIIMKDEQDKYQGLRRPTVTFTEEEHKRIAHYCIDHGMKIGDFIRRAALHCLDNDIIPDKEKDK